VSDLLSIPREQWARASSLLDEALALPSDARAGWLAELAAQDPEMASLLRRLLAAHERSRDADAILWGPPSRLLARALGTPGAMLESGAMVGPYRLLRPIGAGGMATVWLAEQTTAVLRQVALKIPHAGLETHGAAQERYARERDLLATLEHEHIARLYDAGVTSDGIAYLAMELIDGQPVTRFCDERKLSIDTRLALFQQVLQAVGLAHTRLVIHRDLKPSNILVTPAGNVKLLDFGIANLLSDQAAGDASHQGEALTPDTASPEQLEGRALGTTSDVYSLGIVLYELLTGIKPYSLARSGSSLHVALMSTEIGALWQAPFDAAIAASHGSTPVRLRRALRGELTAIVSRCLAKDPPARYQNVDLLAADLERYSRGEPVLAVGGGALYRARRFTWRHRWSMSVGAVLLIVIVAGVGTTLWQSRLAIAEAQRAEAVQNFLLSLFRSNTPSVAEGHELTARDLLAQGSQRLEADLHGQPLALAKLHSELGDIYGEMSDNKSALEHLDRALALYKEQGAADSRDGLEALFRRGTQLMDDLQWERARQDLELCLARGRAVYGPRHRWAVSAREKLAFIRLERDENTEALAIAREALAQPVGEDRDNDAVRRLRVLVIIGEAQTNLGQYAAARATLTQAVKDSAGPAGYSIVDRIVYKLLLARAIYYGGDSLAAEPVAAEVVHDEERLLGPKHNLTFPARELWSHTLAINGKLGQAVSEARETRARALAQTPPNPERVMYENNVLAQQLRRAGQYAEAEPLARQALLFFDQQTPRSNIQVEFVRRTLGETLLGQGRIDEGTAIIEFARTAALRIGNVPGSIDEAAFLDSLATARRVQADLPAASELREAACKIFDGKLGPSVATTRRCRAEAAWLLAMLAPADSNAALAFRSASAEYIAKLPPGHIGQFDLALLGYELDARSGRPPDVQSMERTRQAWRAAMGREPPPHVVFLH
jgi:eukaryotic-like serine/threonine-protein kinase